MHLTYPFPLQQFKDCCYRVPAYALELLRNGVNDCAVEFPLGTTRFYEYHALLDCCYPVDEEDYLEHSAQFSLVYCLLGQLNELRALLPFPVLNKYETEERRKFPLVPVECLLETLATWPDDEKLRCNFARDVILHFKEDNPALSFPCGTC